ncbi:MAG: rhamnose utilization protein RhaD (predicted bifunctional aldolase and dehydrogenase) [Saprospiraceae bacterium]|jgi:rhamnose utilization protein RhaD (predicted bifunctional aldolase and dehydrogenase)/NAD(P)-dependent dehydrogenase (short-subunit alcohol dehydrogenase family)
MKSLWNDKEAKKCGKDKLNMRVYTSRLLGQEEDLVLHGGGNTSVKIRKRNIFGETEEILYVKGSGWDLATIETPGFAPVKLEALKNLAELDSLSDMDMVKYQRMAMIDPSAPNPSVEAILHGIIPYTFVDHTHADAVVVITNSPNGRERIEEIYGPNMLIIPYVMPGFILAKTIYEMTKDIDWDKLDGMILLNHGVFTFHKDPKVSYEKMIEIVSKAEDYLKKENATETKSVKSKFIDTLRLASIRKDVSTLWGTSVLSKLDNSLASVGFSSRKDVKKITNRGPMTPDHIIRTKRTPLYIGRDHSNDLEKYKTAYHSYFNKYKKKEQVLDPAPRWAILPGCGTLSFGPTPKHLRIIEDISRHTKKGITQAEALGGWNALGKKDLFEMEYWSLEQAKLKKAGAPKAMQGRIALVTGAASGIGKACVEQLLGQGAVVAALDIDSKINECFPQASVLGIQCDVTKMPQLKSAIEQTVIGFGGLDMIISNAGIFPKSAHIADMPSDAWNKSMAINVTSHQQLLQLAVPYLEKGIDSAVVIMGSKNVPAPGPGAAAYSVAKAGLTQLARVAALELGGKGIRVNVLHPNAVYDTGIWTDEVLQARADHYGLSVAAYKTNNVLKREVTSKDVANLAVAMLGSLFSKVTGAQLPIDGGNDRVI